MIEPQQGRWELRSKARSLRRASCPVWESAPPQVRGCNAKTCQQRNRSLGREGWRSRNETNALPLPYDTDDFRNSKPTTALPHSRSRCTHTLPRSIMFQRPPPARAHAMVVSAGDRKPIERFAGVAILPAGSWFRDLRRWRAGNRPWGRVPSPWAIWCKRNCKELLIPRS